MVLISLIAGVFLGVSVLALFSVSVWFVLHRVAKKKPETIAQRLRDLEFKTKGTSIKHAELKFGKLLGKGSQGEVFQADWRGTRVAVKKIDTRRVSKETIDEFINEAEIMRNLSHPNLTLFMGVSLQHPHLCIVTECVNRGSLFDLLHDDEASMTWPMVVRMGINVATGMSYLHGHDPPILHRDLKSLNLLVDDDWTVKVSDFGMTRFESDDASKMTRCGSPLWMAPEMVRNESYDERIDVYSFGICMWELYTRKIPYRHLDLNPANLVHKVVKENLRPDIPSRCPKPYARLMQDCWAPNKLRRPNFTQIIKRLNEIRDNVSEEDGGLGGGRQGDGRIVVRQKRRSKTHKRDRRTSAAGVRKILEQHSSSGELDRANSMFSLEFAELTFQEQIQHHERDQCTMHNGVFRGTPVLIKEWDLSARPAQVRNTLVDQLQSGTNRLGHLRHPNLVLLMGSYTHGSRVGIVQEHMANGSLQSIVHSGKHVLGWDTTMQMVLDAALALTYLHGTRPPTKHNHISTANLTVDKNWRVKISEQGAMLFREIGLNSKSSADRALNGVFSAPEIIGRPERASTASDVFSFGMVIWEMFTRQVPYADSEDALFDIKHGVLPDIPATVGRLLQEVISQCWAQDPKQRPTMAEVSQVLEQIKDRGPPRLQLNAENASRFVKKRTVFAYFSTDALTVAKDWGKPTPKSNSWVIVGQDEDVYVIDNVIFKRTYEETSQKHVYRKKGFIWARCMREAFNIKTSTGSYESGNAGDYLLQNDSGEQWSVHPDMFQKIYSPLDRGVSLGRNTAGAKQMQTIKKAVRANKETNR